VPFTRPAHLSTSEAGKFQVWQHALDECEKIYNKTYDIVVDMDCTNPLLDADDLRGILASFRKNQNEIDAMFTVSAARRSPYFNLVEENKNGFLHLSKKLEQNIVSRQAVPKAWDIVAGYYVLSPKFLRGSNYLMDGRLKHYEVSIEKSFDIDEPFDVELVEFLMKRKKAS
jgi:CMP-N,N'-diacetyllegionaminic acid synthase